MTAGSHQLKRAFQNDARRDRRERPTKRQRRPDTDSSRHGNIAAIASAAPPRLRACSRDPDGGVRRAAQPSVPIAKRQHRRQDRGAAPCGRVCSSRRTVIARCRSASRAVDALLASASAEPASSRSWIRSPPDRSPPRAGRTLVQSIARLSACISERQHERCRREQRAERGRRAARDGRDACRITSKQIMTGSIAGGGSGRQCSSSHPRIASSSRKVSNAGRI